MPAAVAAYHIDASPLASPLAGTPVASPVLDASKVLVVSIRTDDYEPAACACGSATRFGGSTAMASPIP
jgi:hypothetical protein